MPCSPHPSPDQQPFPGLSPKCRGTGAQPHPCWLPHSAQGHAEASPPDQQGWGCTRVGAGTPRPAATRWPAEPRADVHQQGLRRGEGHLPLQRSECYDVDNIRLIWALREPGHSHRPIHRPVRETGLAPRTDSTSLGWLWSLMPRCDRTAGSGQPLQEGAHAPGPTSACGRRSQARAADTGEDTRRGPGPPEATRTAHWRMVGSLLERGA